MEGLRLFIFDLDGTLVDAYPAITRSFNHTMRALGLPRRSARTVRAAVGWGDGSLLRFFVSARQLPAALRLYRAHHAQELLRSSRLYGGVRRLLLTLRRRGCRLAVATNRPHRFTAILLKHLKIRPLFDVVVSADLIRHRKPHPQIVNVCMRRCGAARRETVLVGDMPIDVRAGRRAGVRTVAVLTGSGSAAALGRERPDLLIRRVAYLKSHLRPCARSFCLTVRTREYIVKKRVRRS